MDAVDYQNAVEPYAAALRMIREAVGELFGSAASLESEEAVLLRGPEPQHEAEAIIAALRRLPRANVCQQVYDNEINFSISSLWEGIEVKLGDNLSGFDMTTNVRTWKELEAWLAEKAIERYPDSAFEQQMRSGKL